MTRKLRDTYRKRLYAAEAASVDNTPGRVFQNISECQAWIYTVQGLDPLLAGKAWISAQLPHGNATGSWCDFENNVLFLHDEHWNEQAILHELAHFATGEGFSGHGKQFCWNYLDLTLRWRGPSVYLELRNAIRERGIL